MVAIERVRFGELIDAALALVPPDLCRRHKKPGLTDFLYQRDGETIAFARSDLAVSGTGSSSVAPVVGIRAKSVA